MAWPRARAVQYRRTILGRITKHGSRHLRMLFVQAAKVDHDAPGEVVGPRRVRNPIKATAREPVNRPDAYERLPKSC